MLYSVRTWKGSRTRVLVHSFCYSETNPSSSKPLAQSVILCVGNAPTVPSVGAFSVFMNIFSFKVNN